MFIPSSRYQLFLSCPWFTGCINRTESSAEETEEISLATACIFFFEWLIWIVLLHFSVSSKSNIIFCVLFYMSMFCCQEFSLDYVAVYSKLYSLNLLAGYFLMLDETKFKVSQVKSVFCSSDLFLSIPHYNIVELCKQNVLNIIQSTRKQRKWGIMVWGMNFLINWF